MKRRQVCLIGVFPPPLHGMSLINEFVKKRVSVSASPLVIDFSPRNLNRSFLVRFGKIFRVIQCISKLILYLVTGRIGSVYLGLSGGNGQIYDAIFCSVSRVFFRKIYMHHHSFQYINKFRWLTKILFAISGEGAVHIISCDRMARDLKRLYPVVSEIRFVSGISAIHLREGDVRIREKIRSIGFLSNISIEKGIMEFLNVASYANRVKLPIHFILAGPYQDENVKALVETRMASLANVSYIGPVYDDEKWTFFDSIDVFLMPSHNESDPLVIHEAMSSGIPVIAHSRGCIGEIISNQVGLILAPEDDYVSGAIEMLKLWLKNPQEFQLVSQSALNQFNEARLLHSSNMNALCAELAEQ